jgi:hypothetical protein
MNGRSTIIPAGRYRGGFKEIITGIEGTESLIPASSPQTCPIIAKNRILFSRITTGSVIKIYNIMGWLVHTSRAIAADSYEVDISKCPGGVYYFTISCESKHTSNFGKFVVCR